jgi:hypothetical protein
VTIEEILMAGLLGASAGAGLGALAVAHRVGVWARTVNAWIAGVTQDVNTWGAQIERQMEQIRRDLAGTKGLARNEGIRPPSNG